MAFGTKKKRLTEEEEESERKKARVESLAALSFDDLQKEMGEKSMDLCSKMMNNEEGTERYREIEQEAEELEEAMTLKKQRLKDEKPKDVAAPLTGDALADALQDMPDAQIQERIQTDNNAIQLMRKTDPLYAAKRKDLELLRAEIFGRSREGQRLAAERKEIEKEKARNLRRKAALDDLEDPQQHLNAEDKTWWKDNGSRQWGKIREQVWNGLVEQIAQRMGRVAVAQPPHVPVPLELPSGKLPQVEFNEALNSRMEESDKQLVEAMRAAHMAEQTRLMPARNEFLRERAAQKAQAEAAKASAQAKKRRNLQAGQKNRKADPRNKLDQE